MSAPITRKATTMNRMLPLLAAAAGSLLAVAAQAAAPGISGNTITLTASPAYLTQPDGLSVYSWGYGCTGGALASGQSFVPATTTTPFCTTMQVPGPTLVVTEGQTVTVTLTNNLPASAGNTSILFPGFNVSASGVQGLLTSEAAPGSTATYTFTASSPGTRAYYSGTQGDLQVEMASNYAAQYPHQPYNGNPHMHPGELTLLRIIGQGRWQHPFHEHGNHVRILARDGNLILGNASLNYPAGGTATVSAPALAGPLLFTTTTTPGLAMDGIFYWNGRGLNWDAYGHHPGAGTTANSELPCAPDANGYNTGATGAINYFEWCQDHNKPLQAKPFGDVAAGGPVTLPDPNLFTNGAWFGGSPYLGPDATVRATGPTGTTPPSGTIANPPTSEAGFAFMWHSHNEREITTNNIFPGGMLMMMLVDSREFVIDESN